MSFAEDCLTDLFSDPTLQLVRLDRQEYAEAQIEYRSQSSEKEMMLEATLQAVEKKMPSQERYTVLSIGCSIGIFEEPFLKAILDRNKSIHFVGVDPDEEACVETRKWCQKLSGSQPTRFEFEIYPTEFEKLRSRQSFDIILLIHSLYYFPEIETLIRKVDELLEEGGIAIVGVAATGRLLSRPYNLIYRQLNGRPAWFCEDLQRALAKHHFSFHQKTIEFSMNLTKCFQKNSESGKRLLNFIIGANTAYFSPSQLRLLLDYFDKSSRTMENGEIVIPHAANLFYLEKKNLRSI